VGGFKEEENSMAQLRTAIFAVGFACVIAASPRPVFAAGQPLKLDSGLISGVAGNDPAVRVYRGIPFAAAPVGDLRWRAPQPVKVWTGVKAADGFGPQCVGRNFGFIPPARISEDCLYLNVWTPAQARAKRLPVLVWIHGGGFQGGSGSDPSFNGEEFAKQRVVVVTFNYPMWKWALMQRQAGLPVYYYLFGRTLPATPGQMYKGIPRSQIGAFHGDEVTYVFGTLDRGSGTLDGSDRKARWEKTDRELSAAMLRYWANFVKTGDPNGAGLPVWARYEAKANNPLMRFNDRPQVKPDERTSRMKILDAAFQSSPE